MLPVVKTDPLVTVRGAIEGIASKEVLLMKLLSKCKPVGSALVVAASLELPPRVTCNSRGVTSSVVAGIPEV
ncbi:hypothetical protein HanIR_Chr17g0869281 [Helianthus annuus]|nr:hypothetical protein HanIR_Chr17g0869281 [Helianthus annuus]